MRSIGYPILDKQLRQMGGLVQVTGKEDNDLSGKVCLPGESGGYLGQRGPQTNLTTLCRLLRYWLCLLAMLTVAAGSNVYADGTTNIVGSTSGTNLDQTYFAYANAGEYINYSFTTGTPPGSSTVPNTVTIKFYSPTGLYTSRTMTVIGQTVTGAIPVTAATAGIWTIFMDFSVDSGTLFLSPYNIDVTTTTAATSRINGRVYTESYWMIQTGGLADINMYMISEFGYKYSVVLNDYNGIGSRIQTTRYGVRKQNECTSLYKSVDSGSGSYSNGTECGGIYKQFFTPISAALPTSAPRYNIQTNQTISEWLQPPVAGDPTINGLTYTPSNIGNPAAGVFTATIANYAGNAKLQVDVNNNGVYTDAIDRTIPFNVQLGVNTINWDGVNGQGGIVACGTNLRARIFIDKVAEIHFTFLDVEVFGGLKVTRTNGPGAPNSIIYWDDTSLSTTNRTLTSPLNGTAGVNSNTTNGVHGWPGTTTAQRDAGFQEWGNNRYIESWTNLPNVSIQSEIPFSVACDFGDAPNSYATTIGSNGPAHKPTSTLFIGAVAADGEADGQPTGTQANGDDTNGVDDEDGLASAPPILVQCSDVYSLTVAVHNTTGQTAYLRGWVDFNRNGTFDTGEFTSVNIPYDSTNASTIATVTWGNLSTLNVLAGQSYIRLRVSTTNFVSPTGTLNDGEVEDYPVTILPPILFSAVVTDASSCSVADGSITLTATGSTGSYEYSLDGVTYTPFASPYTIDDLGRGGYRIFVRDQNFLSCIGDTLLAVNAPGCCEFYDNQPITGTAFTPGAGITVQYLLTSSTGVILSIQTTPTFPAQAIGDYYIYTLAYSTANPAPTGVTVGQNISGIAGCCYQLYPPDPITVCGCPTITLTDASYSVCTGQNLPVLQVTSTVLNPSQVEFVYFNAPQASAAAVYGTPTAVLGTATSTSGVAALTDVTFPSTPGTYYVYARITPTPPDPSCRPYVEIPVSVSACTPPCDLTVTAFANSATVCVGSPLSLSATAVPAGTYTYAWTGPNGYIGSGVNPTVSATAAITQSGTYTVVVTDAAGCSGTATVSVVINACCDLVASVAPVSVTSCSATTGGLVITYSGSQTYQYSLNGGAFQALGASPFTVSNLAPGSYTVVVQAVGDPNCTTALTGLVEINPITVFATSNSPQCAGNTIVLQALVNDEANGTFQWSGPNGFSGTGQSVTIPNATTLNSGTYTVTFTNAAGCSASASTTVIIANQPSLTLTAGSGQTICSGQSTTLSVGGSNGATVTWANTVGQTGTGTSIVFAGIENVSSVPQSITYVVNANAGTCSDQTMYVLTINPAPVIQVVPTVAVYCDIEQVSLTANVFPNTATINWNRTPATPNPPPASGSGTGTVTIQQTLPAAAYTYTFSATGTNGCTSPSVNIPVTVQQ